MQMLARYKIAAAVIWMQAFVLVPSVFAAAPGSFDEMITAYSAAHAEKDVASLEKLVYWTGVREQEKLQVRKSFSGDISREIETVKVVDLPADQVTEYKLAGITFRPNLKPVKKLVVTFKKQDSTFEVTGSGYLLGQHAGAVYITTAAPVE